MNNKKEVLDGLVEFLPSADMNSHGQTIAKVIESMAEDVLKDCKSPLIPLEYAFRDLIVNVSSLDGSNEIKLLNEEKSTKQYIESLLTGFDRLVVRVKDAYKVRQLRVSVPKKMPYIERQILFEYIDSISVHLSNYEVKYVNTDKVVLSNVNGVKMMAYT